MNYMLLAICDEVSGQWTAPFFASSEAEAIRNFAGSVDALPEYMRGDVSLFHVGDVFIDIGVYRLTPVEIPRRITTGRSVSALVDDKE